jgi:glutamine amidotransferase
VTTIIDYGMGNLGSIRNMLKKIGEESIITSNSSEIEKATRLILPGVGAFDSGMKKLAELNLIPLLNQKVITDRVPILGICLGIQLMTMSSQEGVLPGLGWFDAKTIRFDLSGFTQKLPLPNMGWRQVFVKKDLPLFEGLYEDSWFYFVHNYHVCANLNEDVSLSVQYGYEFTASLVHDNIMGVQFHPEKSHEYGLKLFQNFIHYY